jgi:hypothetical protein
MGFHRLVRAIEAIVRMQPHTGWRLRAPIAREHADACRCARARCIDDVDLQVRLRPQGTPLTYLEDATLAPWRIEQHQAGVAVLVADVADTPAVGRPARLTRIELAERERC